MCKVSDKSEVVGEIIGWFDMELLNDVESITQYRVTKGFVLFSQLEERLSTILSRSTIRSHPLFVK